MVNDIDPGSVHPTLAALNWIYFNEGDEFQPVVQALIEAATPSQVKHAAANNMGEVNIAFQSDQSEPTNLHPLPEWFQHRCAADILCHHLLQSFLPWVGNASVASTWWNLIPGPLFMGISMAIFLANYTLRD